MKRFRQVWVLLIATVLVGLVVVVTVNRHLGAASEPAPLPPGPQAQRAHLDHSAFFNKPLATGPEVTRECMRCHEHEALDLLGTAHFQWQGQEVTDHRTGEKIRIGKRNLLNNFCIGIQGNWPSCTKCHAGYGWSDASFDFTDPANIDCLVCHDHSGTYRKGPAGLPDKGVDLLAVARSVGFPQRDNCGACHNFGGGGQGVKHGDLDSSLDSPSVAEDVHMGGANMLCIDCHGGNGHDIRGRAFSVSVSDEGGIGCTGCHETKPHGDERLNRHTDRVACQTCHIPTFANELPTKLTWDWSKAGDDTRKDDVHHYLKIKGEFQYGEHVVPVYHWFDLSVDRYLLGDPVNEGSFTDLNPPRGSRGEPEAKIWPFKVHTARQPYDVVNRYLIVPVMSGAGGYWHDFDWDQALRLGAQQTGLAFSGQYGFTDTRMYWPLSHMVQPAEQALQCSDCHSTGGRMDWEALGYTGDPMRSGSR